MPGLDEISKAINITRSLANVHLYVTNLGKISNKLVNTHPSKAEALLEEAVIKARKEADEQDLPALLAELSGKYVRLKKDNDCTNVIERSKCCGRENQRHPPG